MLIVGDVYGDENAVAVPQVLDGSDKSIPVVARFADEIPAVAQGKIPMDPHPHI
jgi:hypothetical protein